MAHFKEICKKCGTIIIQCRCMSEDKEVRYGICDKCIDKEVEKEINNINLEDSLDELT